MNHWGKLLAVLGLTALCWLWGLFHVLDVPAGIVAPNPPEQQAVDGTQTWPLKQFQITPLAYYHVQARVLSVQHYDFDRLADISPLDLALGWQSMSDVSVLKKFHIISQGIRFYFYHYPLPPPIPVDDIVSQSANTHIIPADDTVRRALSFVRPYDILDARGYLVRVTRADWPGFSWVSSLVRTDSGDGSCEVFYVTHATLKRVW